MSQRFTVHFAQFMPKAAAMLLLAQIFSSISFATIFAILAPLASHNLHVRHATIGELTTSFLTLNFILHLIGGFIGGRFVSYRILFSVGISLQIIACIFLATANANALYFGLTAFLAGSGLNFPCINCMLTQLFKAEDKRRETAFLFNYSGISLGVLISFLIIYLFGSKHNFTALLLISAFANLIVLLLVISNWRLLVDRTTILLAYTKDTLALSLLKGIIIIICLFLISFYLLRHVATGHNILIILGIVIGLIFVSLAFRQPSGQARKRIWACLIFALITISFWTLYMSTPTLFEFFTKQIVNHHVFGPLLPTIWFNNTSLIVIMFGGFLLGVLLQYLRKKGYKINLPIQFSLALLLLCAAFVIIPIGIESTAADAKVAAFWLLASYVLQALALLFIQPIGYAMIGQLIPINLQGLMMGTWLMFSGIGASIAALLKKSNAQLLADKHFYVEHFYLLAWSTFIVLIILVALIPLLRKLIHYRSLDPTHH